MSAPEERFMFADLKDVRIIPVSGPKNKDQLIAQLYAGISPVTEAGANWDALDEVLNDLSWVKEKDVIIVNAGLDKLPAEDLEIYSDILRSAVERWEGGRKKHRLYAVVPESMRD